MKIWTCHGHITLSKIENLPISRLKPDLHNNSARTKFGKNPLTFTKVIIQKLKYGCVSGRYLLCQKLMKFAH